MEEMFNDEEIKRIFEENDPIRGLSESELHMLNDILIKKQKKLSDSMPHITTEAGKANANPEYADICIQMRIVEARLSEIKNK